MSELKMQVKVLYSFNDNPTVFLSRSSMTHTVRVANIPTNVNPDELVTLGGFDLKSCISQIMASSPENFHLQTHDYAVYYKDLTEQPDEPFVSHGILSQLLTTSEPTLVPGRVCQNVSANFLFGNKPSESLTLEIRLKLHTIEKDVISNPKKRVNELDYKPEKAQKSNSYVAPIKASRTASLPVYPQVYNNHMYNIRTADKLRTPLRYDQQSVLDRFKLASFVDAQALAKPKVLKRRKTPSQYRGTASRSNSMNEPMRAIRTRSMVTNKQTPLMISSPIHEEGSSDTDDTEYNENSKNLEHDPEEDEEEEDDDTDVSPYTPQQPPYRPNEQVKQGFHSLPDLEDLDSKKTHAIPGNKLPADHGLVCVNPNCATDDSITWRYFEIDFHPNYFEIGNSKQFDKKNYEGMFGPLCNACYLFLRNKGFMRPEAVVKKYLKQQRYKRDLKQRDGKDDEKDKHLLAPSRRNFGNSSPTVNHKFVTPSHTPSEINQVIQNTKFGTQNDLNEFLNQLNNYGGPLTDIDPLPQDLQGVTPPMVATKSNTRVINIDQNGEDKENCPPIDVSQFNSSSSPARNSTADFEKMIVRSFNNAPPSQTSSPIDQHNDWMNSLFGGPTPKDDNANQKTPSDSKSEDQRVHPGLPQMKTFNTRRSPRLNKHRLVTAANVPSSPLFATNSSSDDKLEGFLDETHLDMIEKEINNLNKHDPEFKNNKATRNDTTNLVLSLYQSKRLANSSSPTSDIYSDDVKHKQVAKQPSNNCSI